MNRRTFFLSSAAFVSAVTAHSADTGSKLLVEASYTGSGEVNQSHKVYVVLWDTPDFVKENASGIEPIGVKGITSKSAEVEFDDIQKNPVYISMAYDPTGKWEATSAPPIG